MDHYSSSLNQMKNLTVSTNPVGQKPNNSHITSYAFVFISLQESVTSEWDLHHDYTTSQLGLHDLLREWRAEMDIYSREPGRYRYGSYNNRIMVLYNKLGLAVLLSTYFATKYMMMMPKLIIHHFIS